VQLQNPDEEEKSRNFERLNYDTQGFDKHIWGIPA
jgi:hypothetical protein